MSAAHTLPIRENRVEHLSFYPSHSGGLESLIKGYRDSIRQPDLCSRLTGSGYPLELTFCSREEQPRFTLDPLCSSHSAEQRLAATAELLNTHFGLIPDNCIRQQMQSLQRGPLEYGAWLGLRNNNERLAAKIYAEIAQPFCSQQLPETWASLITGSGIAMQPRMLGHDLCKQTQELYLRSLRLTPEQLACALAPIGQYQAGARFVDRLESLYGQRLRDRIPGGVCGVSYTLDQQANPQSMTLFVYARSFWGRDRRIRQQFTRIMRQHSVSPEIYRRSTANCLHNDTPLTQHGMLAVSMTTQGDMHYALGFCPYVGRGSHRSRQ